jgi:hypothetical protein
VQHVPTWNRYTLIDTQMTIRDTAYASQQTPLTSCLRPESFSTKKKKIIKKKSLGIADAPSASCFERPPRQRCDQRSPATPGSQLRLPLESEAPPGTPPTPRSRRRGPRRMDWSSTARGQPAQCARKVGFCKDVPSLRGKSLRHQCTRKVAAKQRESSRSSNSPASPPQNGLVIICARSACRKRMKSGPFE